ncbi:MAG: hypothetical protein EHM56_05145 [Chloroflexi bacterium]|nr:MAG: hypothetical protein EHM56_05145 [Chloroflexota bacterium]
MRVRFEIHTQVSATADLHANEIRLSDNSGITNLDRWLGNCNLASVAPGATVSCQQDVVLPAGLVPRSYYVGILADVAHTVAERDEGNNTAYAYPLVVESPPVLPDLTISGIEVTQAIQCYSGGVTGQCPGGDLAVPLIKNKLAIARVYVAIDPAYPESYVDGVTADLHVSNGSTSRTLKPLNGPIQANKPALRFAIDDAVNFLIPLDLLAGAELRWWAEVRTVGDTADANVTNNRYPAAIGTWKSQALLSRRKLKVGFVPIKVTIGVTPFSPDLDDIPYTEPYAATVFPVPGIDIARYQTFSYWSPLSWGVEDDLILELNVLHALYEAANGADTLDQLIGWVNPAAVDAGGQSDPTWNWGSGKVAWGALDGNATETFAHEMAHNYGRRHSITPPGTLCYDARGYDDETDWPTPDSCAIQEYGLDPLEPDHVMTRATHDFMSYQPGQGWVAPWTYSKLVDAVPEPAAQIRAPDQVLQRIILASGLVTSDGTASLAPLLRMETLDPPPAPGGSDYHLRLLDGAHVLLAEVPFGLSFVDTETGEPRAAATFSLSVPDDARAARLELWQGGQLLTHLEASAHPPAVTLLSPQGGAAITGTHAVSWQGEDLDGDDITYALFYSSNAATSWQPLGIHMTTTLQVVDATALPGSTAGLYRVVASDGFYTASDETDQPFVVGHQPPAPQIVVPPAGKPVAAGATTILAGAALTPGGGAIADRDFAWSSDRAGVLGNGPTLVLTGGLDAGVHTITLVVTDSTGLTGTQKLYLSVLPDADGDGMLDAWELEAGLDPAVDDAAQDPDDEGLSNLEESRRGTDPFAPDSDHDGVDDRTEIRRGSDPLDPGSTPGLVALYLPVTLHH